MDEELNVNVEELIDFDIENEDIENFDPMIHKMTDEIAKKLDLKNRIIDSKLKKKEVIEKLVVELNGIPYNGDDVSQNRMSATGTLANYFFISNLASTIRMVAGDPNTAAQIANAFNDIEDEAAREQAKQLAIGISLGIYNGLANILDGVFNQVYKDTKIGWKDSNDTIRQVQGESVLKALHKSMLKVGEVIAKAEQGLL